MSRQNFSTALLVGKSIVLRKGLARTLRSANFRILASVSCVDDLRLGKTLSQPPLVLILHTGDYFDTTLEEIAFFKELYPDGRIAVVAERYRLSELISAFRAGVRGYFVNIMARV
jgi:DNA-binding NarL/FixJ family response regulator